MTARATGTAHGKTARGTRPDWPRRRANPPFPCHRSRVQCTTASSGGTGYAAGVTGGGEVGRRVVLARAPAGAKGVSPRAGPPTKATMRKTVGATSGSSAGPTTRVRTNTPHWCACVWACATVVSGARGGCRSAGAKIARLKNTPPGPRPSPCAAGQRRLAAGEGDSRPRPSPERWGGDAGGCHGVPRGAPLGSAVRRQKLGLRPRRETGPRRVRGRSAAPL